MTFIPVPNTVSIGLEFQDALNPVSCILAATHAAGFTIADMENLAKAIIDNIALETGGPTIFATSLTQLVSIKVTDLTSVSSPTIDWTTGTTNDLPFTGNDAAGPAGGQVCGVVTWQTLARGRSFRGRNYWPGIPQDKLLDPTHLNASYTTLLESQWLAIHNGINTASAGSWTHVVISRHSGGVPRVTGITTPVATLRMNSKLGTQRRRLAR